MNEYELLMITGMTLVTFGVRYPVLALLGRIELPETVAHTLRFVPPAVLAAIIMPALLTPNGGEIYFHWRNTYLIAGIVTALIAWWRNNLTLALISGMATLWLWRWLLTFMG